MLFWLRLLWVLGVCAARAAAHATANAAVAPVIALFIVASMLVSIGRPRWQCKRLATASRENGQLFRMSTQGFNADDVKTTVHDRDSTAPANRSAAASNSRARCRARCTAAA